jgi:adenylate cyclase
MAETRASWLGEANLEIAMRLFDRLHDMICGEGRNCMPDGASDRLAVAIREEEYEALKLSVGLRFLVMIVVTVQVTVELRWPLALNYYGYIAALAFSGYLQLLLRKPHSDRPWMQWVFPFVDMGILAAGIALPNPFEADPLPPPLQLGFDVVLYFVLFVVLASLGQSARVVFATCLAAIISWAGATVFILSQPGVTFRTYDGNLSDMSALQRMAFVLDPWNVRPGELFGRLLLIGLIGILLTVSVLRSRHLIARQVEAERARRNLSRHFSPHIAETIAQMDEVDGKVRQINAAVLFADLVGFTQIADDHTPEQTIALLREVHQRLARAVAQHRGTLDKYLGDGIMASFGTPEPGPRDASAALLAARSMLHEMEHLNRQRELLRQTPLSLVIGLHYGPLTLGNIGDEHRVEYALIGETVNVAHRLEQMTRVLNAQICVSQAFVDKLAEETRNDLTALSDMVALKPQPIRGVRERMVIWILQRPVPPTEAPMPHATPTIH